MIDFGKYTWTIISAYGGTIFIVMILIIQTLLKSKKTLEDLNIVEQETTIDAKD